MPVSIERKGNLVRFIDTSGLTHDQLTRIMYKFQYLGYTDLTETDYVKEYFDRHNFLNEDQSVAVLDILDIYSPEKTKYSQDIINNAISDAVAMFGTTALFSKAGYLLPDGRLLDFSERQNRRTLDHRSIRHIFPDEKDPNECMLDFMEYGCARISEHSLNIIQPLTDMQRTKLLEYANKLRHMSDNSFYMDITNPEGTTIRSEIYDINLLSDMHKLFDDTEKYFSLFSL